MRISRRSFALLASLATLLLAPSAASALTQTDLDSSYGAAGVVTPALAGTNDDYTIAPQADGKIVGAYVTTLGTPVAFRLNSDGSLDGTFGTGGTVGLAVLGSTSISIDRIHVAGDGTIYVAGDGSVAGFDRVAIWALTPAGAPKLSFNVIGAILLPTVGASDNQLGDAALTPTGEIAVVAESEPAADKVISLRVVTATGTVTTNVTKDFPGYDTDPTSVTVLSDGRIVVGAAIANTSLQLSGLILFSAAGVFDGTFGSGGGLAYFGPPVPMFSVPIRIFNVSGRIGAVGMVGYATSIGIYSTAGIPIPEIGSVGASRMLPPGASYAYSVDGAAVGSGKIVAVGNGSGAATLPPYIIRYNGDGSPDPSFAPGGNVYLPIEAGALPSFALQPDGKYVIALRKNDDSLVLMRIWGDSPAPQPATVAFSNSVKSKQKASKAKRFAGTTGGTGVSKVEVAIQRVDSKLLKKSKKCSYVKSKSASLKNFKAVAGKCAPGVWLKATGTGTWSLRLSKALKPGKYVISARATGVLGLGGTVTKSVTLTK